MKISFEIARTGKELLAQNVVMPQHAEVIRKVKHDRKVRMYDAAANTNLNGDFPISISSANAEILVSIIASRSRARRLERDNPYASGILTHFQNNVVGDEPFRLEMKVGKYNATGVFEEETETNRIIEEAWKDAGLPKNCTVRRDTSRLELYHQIITAVIRDGGILLRHWRGFAKNAFGYAIEALEIDRLDPSYMGKAENGNEIQFSIELDQWRAPEAFYLLTRHPGDYTAYNNFQKYRERVDAKDVIHFASLRTRAEQFLGMPRFVSIIQRLHRLDQYDVAEMTAAIVTACKMGFFVRKPDAAGEYHGDIKDDDGNRVMKAEPGAFEELPQGVEVDQFDPQHPVEAYPNFTKQNLRSVATGAGMAYHTLANDLEGVNFSSGRLGENAQRDEAKKLQKHMIFSCVAEHFNEWLKYAILSGQVKLPITRLEEFKKAAIFHAKRWAYVNPLQDAQTDILRIEAGLDSRSRVIAESDYSGDFEDVCREQSSDQTMAEKYELDFSSSDPTTPTVAKGEPGEGKPNAEDATPAAPATTGGKQTIKKSRVNWEKVERTLRRLHESEPENIDHKENLEQFLSFRRARNGSLTGKH